MVGDELAIGAVSLLDRRLSTEPRRQRLLRCARRARPRADLLHLVVLASPAAARQPWRPTGAELARPTEAERSHVRHVRAERRRRRRGDPDSRDRWIRRNVLHGYTEAVVGALPDEHPGNELAGRHAVLLGLAVGDCAQRLDVRRIE